MSAVASNAVERYQALFAARPLARDSLSQRRRSAMDRWAARGFPTQREEDWKYTNLRRLETRQFEPAQPEASAPDTARWLQTTGLRIVFVNGHAAPELSNWSVQPPGVTVLTLRQWMGNNPDEVSTYLEEQGATTSSFEALNEAFFDDGVVIEIGDDIHVDDPIYLLHHWSNQPTPTMAHPRIVVRAGRGSRCTLIEHYLGDSEVDSFTNSVVSLQIAAAAHVSHYRVQQESQRAFHIASVAARIAQNGNYRCQDIALGAALARTSIHACLEGPGAHADLRGLFVPGGTQHIDTYTLVDHAAAHTGSNEEYRGIASERGRGVYRGKVIVRKNAQKIDSRQSSRNLLLSAGAEIDTRPELEIYANDVKCSHGATTGQLDATALFYLRSRGLSESQARAVLIRAFAESVLTAIEPRTLRDYLEQQLNVRFAGSEVPA